MHVWLLLGQAVQGPILSMQAVGGSGLFAAICRGTAAVVPQEAVDLQQRGPHLRVREVAVRATRVLYHVLKRLRA